MKSSDNNILIIGVGNNGRQDDGLGWAFLDNLDKDVRTVADLEYRYQLQIEDAELISHYDTVYFVDADHMQHQNGFQFRKARPRGSYNFGTHQLHPETVLYLVSRIYHRTPNAFILGITGESFNLKMGLTENGEIHLQNALEFLTTKLHQPVI